MRHGDGMVLSTFPKLLVKPRFGKVFKLPPNNMFAAGEYIWIEHDIAGKPNNINKLDDIHLLTERPPNEVIPHKFSDDLLSLNQEEGGVVE